MEFRKTYEMLENIEIHIGMTIKIDGEKLIFASVKKNVSYKTAHRSF